MHSHTGRETFINHCLNDLGVPPDDICRYTGHSNVHQIHAYAKIKKTRSIRISNEKLKEFEEKINKAKTLSNYSEGGYFYFENNQK